MSKWNRPMRRYQSFVVCVRCGQPLKDTKTGWTHVGRTKITDPTWHIAEPSAWVR